MTTPSNEFEQLADESSDLYTESTTGGRDNEVVTAAETTDPDQNRGAEAQDFLVPQGPWIETPTDAPISDESQSAIGAEEIDEEDEAAMEAADPREPPVPGSEVTPPLGQEEAPEQPPIDPQVAQRLQQENAQLRQRQIYNAINQQVGQAVQAYAKHLVDTQGWYPEQAQQHALSEGKAYAQQMYQHAQQYEQAVQQEQQAKVYTAQRIAQHFGVDQKDLMVYSNPQQMFAAAQGMGRYAAQAQQERRQREQNQRSSIPPQHYNQPAQVRGEGDPNRTISLYARGDIPWSPRVQKAMETLGIS